jgi:hypothetical protein
VTLLAVQTALWLGLALAVGFLSVLGVVALLVADVERFIALTEEARSSVPSALRW